MNRTARTILGYLAVIFLVVVSFQLIFSQATKPTELSLTEFDSALAAGEISGEVVMKDKSNELSGTVVIDGTASEFPVRYPAEYSPDLTKQLQEANVDIRVDAENPTLFTYLISFVPYPLIFGLFFFVIMQMQGGGNKIMQFGKSNARIVTKDIPTFTFADVAVA